AAARGGEILVSSLVRELTGGAKEFAFDGGRELELKGLSGLQRAFAVEWEEGRDPARAHGVHGKQGNGHGAAPSHPVASFPALAASQPLACWFVWRRFVGSAGWRAAVDPQRAISMHVVCWALCEAIALYGLVIGLVARSVEPVFFVWGLIALLLLRPRAENFG